MSINSQRAALRRSAINLDRIRRSLRNFGQGIKSAKIQSDEILKQTRERNRFKSSLINRDDKFFRLRQENIKRKNREDALEATTINGSTKLQGSILQKSSRGFLGRMLDFLGILLIGWSVRNLPRIIEGIERLKKNITDAVGILSDFMGGVTDALLGIGAGLSDFFTQFRRFDFSLNRRSIMEEVDKIINNSVLLNKNLVTAFNNFENDPDLNKAIENMDEDSADGEDSEEEEEIPNLNEKIKQQFEDKKFDESTTKKINDTGMKALDAELKKGILDLDSFFNKNKKDGEQEEIDLSSFDEIEKQLNEFEEKTEGAEERLEKDLAELSDIKPKPEEVKAANFLAMDIDSIFNLAKKGFADFKGIAKKEVVCENLNLYNSDDGPDLSFNPYKPNQNMNLGNGKRKRRDTIFVVERPVGGISVGNNSGGDTNIIVNGENSFDTFNTMQSAQLKYT